MAGLRPGTTERVLSKQTVAIVVSIMATCGMYNESGNYLMATGMPAKSGVSGVIVAVVPGIAGIAVASPRLNDKGGSVRGHLILRELSRQLGWHFALAAENNLAPSDGRRRLAAAVDAEGCDAFDGRVTINPSHRHAVCFALGKEIEHAQTFH